MGLLRSMMIAALLAAMAHGSSIPTILYLMAATLELKASDSDRPRAGRVKTCFQIRTGAMQQKELLSEPFDNPNVI